MSTGVRETDRYDVAVVGYGPVGMAMAALLGRSGHSVVVLERYPDLYNLPRAAIFDDETMRTFAELGIAETLLPRLHVQRNYEWRNGAGELLIEHDFAEVGASGWAEWYMMYQPDLEDALDAAVRATGAVDVRFSTPVTGYRPDADGVRIETGGAPVHARWVVACDGGNSFTRRLLGIGQTDLGFSEPWLVCDFALLSDPGLPKARQVCDPAQPISIIALGHDHHRFSFMIDSEAAFDTERDPAKVWARVSGYLRPDQAELVRVATYTFRSLLTHRWREGRILLAGDAAHQMPPFLGQGMVSGIRDAKNLAMRFDLVLGGVAEDTLFDSYQSEREPHVEAVITKGIELGRVQTMRDPVLAARRDEAFIADRREHREPVKIRFPGIGAGLVEPSPGAGALVPQGRVSDGCEAGRFDEVLGHGWFEVSKGDADPDGPAGLTVVRLQPDQSGMIVSAPTAVADLEQVYGSWLEEHQAYGLVVRPDYYVYGTASTPEALAALRSRLRAAWAGRPALTGASA
ncbi:bifunctional 3-(3-hydroxy-phenyl)propionate/3-hydroxycinnamic acid hydroxylase [uncultured Friedmanniella sp.]|uniref:bifunctional 3-(3-hydroxy-phenyl)propionate/3-hydroxycinnamic acid hydroxylase n=1 Tax=uncultured Friedmanniella sp. TaxID=335381 RepID=UPI0035CAC9FA